MSSQYTESISDLLAAARGDRSYRWAAAQLGISDPMYKQWETGYASPGWDRANDIADFVGVSRTDVLVLMGVLTPEEGDKLRSLDGEDPPDTDNGPTRYLMSTRPFLAAA